MYRIRIGSHWVNESSSSNFQLGLHHLSELPRNGAIECSFKYEPYELSTKHQLQSKWCLEQRQSRPTIAPIIQSLQISGSTTESIRRQWVSSPTEPPAPCVQTESRPANTVLLTRPYLRPAAPAPAPAPSSLLPMRRVYTECALES